MSNAKNGCILSKDEWKSMFTSLPQPLNIEFEPFCSGCANAKIEILRVNYKEIDITCSNIDGCRFAYEKGKSEEENTQSL